LRNGNDFNARFKSWCLLDPVSFAEFSLYPKLVIPGNIEQTVQNISLHGNLFYVLLVPVNKALSLLTAWFRLMYTAIAFAGPHQCLRIATVVRPGRSVTKFVSVCLVNEPFDIRDPPRFARLTDLLVALYLQNHRRLAGHQRPGLDQRIREPAPETDSPA
jgi:hypothetical protein